MHAFWLTSPINEATLRAFRTLIEIQNDKYWIIDIYSVTWRFHSACMAVSSISAEHLMCIHCEARWLQCCTVHWMRWENMNNIALWTIDKRSADSIQFNWALFHSLHFNSKKQCIHFIFSAIFEIWIAIVHIAARKNNVMRVL